MASGMKPNSNFWPEHQQKLEKPFRFSNHQWTFEKYLGSQNVQNIVVINWIGQTKIPFHDIDTLVLYPMKQPFYFSALQDWTISMKVILYIATLRWFITVLAYLTNAWYLLVYSLVVNFIRAKISFFIMNNQLLNWETSV